ncbi:MAG: Rrf2 family transcriptional regulator [Bryobacteraceae bacterium]
MQLTRAADYAVRVMIHLAGLPPGTRASRGELAGAAECPEQFLSKVLQSLTRAGLVISHRGNTGGFELQEARRSASVLTVVEAIEGPIRLNLCLTSDHACSRQGWCPAHGVWAEAQESMMAVLQSASVGKLAEKAAGGNGNGTLIDNSRQPA